MTRKEEIEKVANEFYKGDEVSTFVVAAQWADKTMIEKACKWILHNMPKYVKASQLDVFINNEDMANDFKRAMEE